MKTESDSSGVNVRMTREVQPKKAGVLVMGHMGSIPPLSTGMNPLRKISLHHTTNHICFLVYLETSCQFPEGNLKIRPFGFRTHTHNLGTVVSGYRVSPSKDTWTLIGKMDPRQVSNIMFQPLHSEEC